jgi:hypothetical protein
MDRLATLLVGATLLLSYIGHASAQTTGDEPDQQQTEDDPREEPETTWPLADLGTFEEYAVRRALESRDWTIDPDPAGKRVAEVHVVTLPVFSKRQNEALRWFNRLHETTKTDVVRREVLLEPGERWNGEDARETERNLRDPTFTSLAVVVPIATHSPETFDVLVVTRDIWSLRPSVDFEYQDGKLTEFFLSISESNLLGRHKAPGAFYHLELGRFAFGPRYFDPNVFGSHVQFSTRGRAIFNRQTGNFEGSRSNTSIAYPLWNLDRTWGAELTIAHADEVVREFQGTDLLQFTPPGSPDSGPYKYRFRTFDAQALVHYAVGESIEHRFSTGYRFHFQRARLTPDFPGDRELRRAFQQEVLPPLERNSGPLFAYSMFVPEWNTYRNISTYDLPEEKRVGPYLDLRLEPVREEFGSSRNYLGMTATGGALIDLFQDGYVSLETSVSTRRTTNNWLDNRLTARLDLTTPDAFQAVRFVGRSQFEWLTADTQNRLLLAGGRSGLRGYPIGAFAGDTRFLNNLELRTLPLDVWVTKLGGVLFWDAGGAGGSPDRMLLRQNVGLGLRVLIPQANTVPLRVDWALPIGDGVRTLPGRLSVGFGQVF